MFVAMDTMGRGKEIDQYLCLLFLQSNPPMWSVMQSNVPTVQLSQRRVYFNIIV